MALRKTAKAVLRRHLDMDLLRLRGATYRECAEAVGYTSRDAASYHLSKKRGECTCERHFPPMERDKAGNVIPEWKLELMRLTGNGV